MLKRLGMLLLSLVLAASMMLGATKKRTGGARSRHYSSVGKKSGKSSRKLSRGKSAKRKGYAKGKRRSGIAKSRRSAAKKHRHA
jgi:hypothetical protein